MFMGKLPASENTNRNSTKSVHKMRQSLTGLKGVLQGYYDPEDLTQKALVDLFQVLNEPVLPVEEIKEDMSSLTGRIPLDVITKIADKIQTFKKHKKTLDTDRKRSDFEALVVALRDITTKYKHGWISDEEAFVTELSSEYFTVVMALNSADLSKIFSIARSHTALEAKNKLLLQLLAQMARGTTVAPRKSMKSAEFMPLLEKLATCKEKQRFVSWYRSYPMETMSFSDIFAKTFQFKSPVVDALALGIAPAECYDDLASLLRHNSSASSLDLGAHNSEEGSKE
ncbi:hypothetical protein PC121_g22610 [Phytophthora cactorum]|nr:hypothetical protein PC121_g22610 [Phytophthora cactorum]